MLMENQWKENNCSSFEEKLFTISFIAFNIVSNILYQPQLSIAWDTTGQMYSTINLKIPFCPPEIEKVS